MPSSWMPTLLALQVADGSDGLVREQLVAAGVHPRQRGDRLAGIHPRDHPCRGLKPKSISPRATASATVPMRQIADISEPFGAQQLLSDVLAGRQADLDSSVQPERRRLRRPLVGERSPGAEDARGAGQRQR